MLQRRIEALEPPKNGEVPTPPIPYVNVHTTYDNPDYRKNPLYGTIK